MGDYSQFITSKFAMQSGRGVIPERLPHGMFPHQLSLVNWAARRGRAAIFADTGLGKTRMELAWADCMKQFGPVLILAPLAVAAQTQAEGERIGLPVTICRQDSDVRDGMNVTNYDRLHKFDAGRFAAVVLDESSVIKHHDAKTFSQLTDAFRATPYKLCATATPAPNDWTELGTHAEFLGVRSRQEMLSEFFVHDGGDTQTWRLKGHAKHEFWRWVASWGAMVRLPSDLGFADDGYRLPPLHVRQHTIDIESTQIGLLFDAEALTLADRRAARKASLDDRVAACAGIVNSSAEPWVVWCDLNAEGDMLKRLIPDAVEIRGSDSIEEKESRLESFAAGRVRVLISKPSICGWGLNWQHCRNIAFVGVTDSYEAYYQAVRRCWRFGQQSAVNVHVFASSLEGAVIANLARKERDAAQMAASLAAETADAVRSEVLGYRKETNEYAASQKINIPSFLAAA